MTKTINDKIKMSLQAAEGLYHRLVLLVGEVNSGKTSILIDVAKQFDTPVINVNLVLSSKLLELSAKQRSLHLLGIFDEITDKAKSPLFLDNIEILFDTKLKQDPLRLLQSISRNRSVVSSWNGTFIGGRLLYAEIGHPEYRSYDSVDAMIVNI